MWGSIANSLKFVLVPLLPAILIYRNMSKTERIPSAYIPHGGGPLPILGDEDHKSMVSWLSKFASTYLSDPKPSSVLVISAHWESDHPTIQSGDTSSLYYDYYNFPKEAYALKYEIQPDKRLAQRVAELLKSEGIEHKYDKERGFDHGVFIPLMLIYPNAQVPTIQLSLVKGLDPEQHIKIGEALAPLRDEGVFILGSGMSYHNMRGFFGDPTKSNADSESFHTYLRNSLDNGKTYDEKVTKLIEWKNAPKARENHPREEHLIPLMVILGTSKPSGGSCKEAYFDKVSGVKSAGYVFD